MVTCFLNGLLPHPFEKPRKDSHPQTQQCAHKGGQQESSLVCVRLKPSHFTTILQMWIKWEMRQHWLLTTGPPRNNTASDEKLPLCANRHTWSSHLRTFNLENSLSYLHSVSYQVDIMTHWCKLWGFKENFLQAFKVKCRRFTYGPQVWSFFIAVAVP
jgi:hypothetical protein